MSFHNWRDLASRDSLAQHHWQTCNPLSSAALFSSSHLDYSFPGGNSRRSKDKAIAAGVVGGILFFIASIVLSVCTVKICNERKRRKAEKGW